MRWLDLDFANLNDVVVLKELDHANTLTFDFYSGDVALLPALCEMTEMAIFIPLTPSGDKETLVYRAAKLIEPVLLFGCC